jgi:methylmalonyl-CoA/ethylmalonyl-CoA epimerase
MTSVATQARILPPRRIGQIAVVVQDVERATTFYRDVLGLQHLFSAPPGLSFFRCGEVRLMLASPEGADPEKRSSVLYYDVEDLDAAYRSLADKGVAVVTEPHVIHRTESTELRMAFFEDGEGNMFALMSEVSTGRTER